MKITIKNIQDFDVLSSAIDPSEIQDIENDEVGVSFKELIRQGFNSLKTAIKSLRKQKIKNLSELSLGAYLDACQVEKPSEFVKIIADDLKLKYISVYDSIRLWKKWQNELKTWTERIEKSQPHLETKAEDQAIYQQASDAHKLPSFVFLIDQIAKRYSISHEEAQKITLAEVLVVLNIDAINAEVENRQFSRMRKK